MPIATPEQFRSYVRRSIGGVLIELAAIPLGAVAAVLGFVALGAEGVVPKLVAGSGLVGIFLLGQAARRACFRCPVCSAALPRGPRHVAARAFFNGHCTQCDTRFVRQARPSPDQ